MSAPTASQATSPVPDVPPPEKPSLISTLINHPIGFWFIFWGELAERCSFYGMMAILPRFIADDNGLYLGDANSNTWVSMFKAGAYVLPLVGGFLADQYLGKYRLIVMFSIPYILGHVLMSYETVFWTMVALSLLAMGSGIIKPNISTLMGMTYDQMRPGDEALRSMAFGMFYMAINVGAALSYFFLPLIRDDYGYSIAFMCPAVLMAVSFLIFAAGKPFYAVETIVYKESTPEETALKWLTLRRVAGIFLVITFFWAIFDQSHTIWIFFARDFTDLRIFGWEISVEQIGTLNPVLIVIFVPLMPVLWNFVESKGYTVRPTDKIIIGFVLTMLSMLIMAIAGYQCDAYEDKVVVKSERSITNIVVDDPSKVTVGVVSSSGEGAGKKEYVRRRDKAKPAAELGASKQVTITVVSETKKEAPVRVVTPRYEKDVRPILNGSCVQCHGKTATAGLDLRTLEGIMKPGKSGPAVVANDPKKSLIFKDHKSLIPPDTSEDAEFKMIEQWTGPGLSRKQLAAIGDWLEVGLTTDQTATITHWIEKGATSTAARSVSLWWEVLAFITLTLAEVLISITGLELAFVVAPQSMKSFVTACWLMTVAIANFFINAPVGRLYSTMSPGNYHLMLTGLMVVVIVAFYFVAQQFNQMAAEQEAAEKAAGQKAETPAAGAEATENGSNGKPPAGSA
ncbi:MAG: MFS transporter [Planctomycetes bacterium]|nr:MFS transporter [Planctomycetota bacterium]